MSQLTLAFVHGMLTDHIFTQESDGDPSLIIALSNEATLGNIMRTNHCLIPPLRGPPVPLPHTTATKTWMRNLVFANVAAPAAFLEPEVSANPPMVYQHVRNVNMYSALQ